MELAPESKQPKDHCRGDNNKPGHIADLQYAGDRRLLHLAELHSHTILQSDGGDR